MLSPLDRVRIILVRPQHPGNVGAAARALKNMGLKDLVVVADAPPDLRRAAIMAPHAEDVLNGLTHCTTLDAAMDGVVWAVATTARPRQWRYAELTPRDLGVEAVRRTGEGRVAILFGQEDFGLDNDAVTRCHAVCEIPTAGMRSLNLAQAVLIIAYEILLASGAAATVPSREAVQAASLEPLIAAWVEAWQAVGYLRGRNPVQFVTTLRQILGRAALETRELEVLRGFFNKLRGHLQRTGALPPKT